MPLEGHWQRVNTPLRRLSGRERNIAIAAVVVTIAACVALIVATAGTSRPAPGPGCIRALIPHVMGSETLDACAEAVGLADVVSLAGAVELAGPADLDAAVLPHAASATAAPMGVIAGSRPTRPASRRGQVPTEADPPGPLVGLRGIVCSSRRRGFRRQSIVGGRRGVLPPAGDHAPR